MGSNGRRRVGVPQTRRCFVVELEQWKTTCEGTPYRRESLRYSSPCNDMPRRKNGKTPAELTAAGAPWKTCTVWQEASTVPTKTPQNTTQTRRFLLNHNEAKALENQGKRCNHRCARWDSTPHHRSHRHLNPARLPITPLARIVQNPRWQTPPRA